MKYNIVVVIVFMMFSIQLFAVDVTFDVSKPGSQIIPKYLNGTCLPVWNSSGTYDNIKKGLQAEIYPGGKIVNYQLIILPPGYYT